MANKLSSDQQVRLLYQISGLIGNVSDLYTSERAEPWENAEMSVEQAALGAASYAAQGAALGTAIAPGIGTAIGAGVGLIAGGLIGDSQRKAKLAQIRRAQDARAIQIMNNIESRSKNIVRAKTQFEKALSSSRFADVGDAHFKSLGVKYGYLHAQPGGVTNVLHRRALSNYTVRSSSLIEGAKIALSEKIRRYETAMGQVQDVRAEIWENRRSGEFDASGLNTIQELLEI